MGIPEDDIYLMNFTGLRNLMTESGYGFIISRTIAGPENIARAWLLDGPCCIVPINQQVTSDEYEPDLALRELYRKCCEKWPKPGPFDGKSLELLIGECVERKWHPIIKDYTSQPSGRWIVYWDDITGPESQGLTLYMALKDAMTKRLKAETAPQSDTATPQRAKETYDRYPHG